MQRIKYDMIYLSICGLKRERPSDKFIEAFYELKEVKLNSNSEKTCSYLDALFRLSKFHFLDSLIGTVLKQAQVTLPKQWEERISKAKRKELLFDVERKKLCSFMESESIWYMPLKGIVLKDIYPGIGLRQMSDNDILFDSCYSQKIKNYMKSQGYEFISVGKGIHDVYQKPPIYNFEMHRALFGTSHEQSWCDYYQNVKERLIQNKNTSYGYHFSDEDFYVYLICHAYKHYRGSGTGLRTLIDIYVYLSVKGSELNFEYIEQECKVLNIADFERENRELCQKLMVSMYDYDMEVFEEKISEKDSKLLAFYYSSGTYGTINNYVTKRVQEKGKLNFFLSRIFMPYKVIKKSYTILNRYPFLLPLIWTKRLFLAIVTKDSRERGVQELKALLKYTKKEKRND